jgi:hypothetical protein
MEIYLDRRAVRQIRASARNAIEDGDAGTLPEQILEVFSDDDVRSIEQLLDGGELGDFLASLIDEWGGDDVDELFDLLESQFADIGVDLSTEYRGDIDDTEVLEEEDEFPETDDLDDEDEDEGEEEEEEEEA